MSEVKRYRKRPVVIEAIQLEMTKESFEAAYAFIGTNVDFEKAQDGSFINIKTLEGTMQAQIGDFIIKGVNGEFYPCKPDIFAKTYEEVKT
jgi:hypothetical protein